MDPPAAPTGISISDKVNQEFVTALKDMGFTKEVSEKAIFLTQNSSLEAAMNWIEEHQSDPDFLEELQIVAEAPSDAPQSKLTPQEAAAKARELQERIRKKRAEEEKKLELENERNRIRVGREMTMARQQAEESETKRLAEARLREKRLQEKELADIKEQLRREKEAKYGKSFAEAEEQKHIPPREQMATAIKTVKTLYPQFRSPGVAKSSLSILRVYLTNLIANPTEDKFRRIRNDNKAFQDRVAKISGAINFLKAVGFSQDGDFWVMGPHDAALLEEGVRLLDEALATLS